MAIPFPQTTRALQADQDQVSLLALVFLIIMLTVWGVWFFSAAVHTYTSTTVASLSLYPQPGWEILPGSRRPTALARYRIQGSFKADQLSTLKTGQPVKVHFAGQSLLPMRAYAATVSEVDVSRHLAYMELELPATETSLNPLGGALVSRLDVATQTRTPAAFLFSLVMGGGSPPVRDTTP